MLRFVVFAALLSVSFAATYPTTYPFEKETYKPPELPKHGDVELLKGVIKGEVPGGYVAASMQSCDPFKNSGAPGFGGDAKNRACMITHLAWVYNFKNKPATRVVACYPEFKKNLTKSDFPGMIASKSICTDCCKDIIGYVAPPGSIAGEHSHFNQWSALGGCSVLNEPAYCSFMTHFMYTCAEMYALGETKRPVARTCYDVMVSWMLTCKLFRATGVGEIIFSRYQMEPKAYLDKLSSVQTMVVRAGLNQPDRVCMPYSYYFPASSPPDSSSAGKVFFMLAVATSWMWM